jgi:hypothetical protein
MEEAERQLRVAQRLYETTNPELPWSKLTLSKRRPFIDQSCQPPHGDEDS